MSRMHPAALGAAAVLLVLVLGFFFYRVVIAPRQGASDTTSLTILGGAVSIERGEPPKVTPAQDGMTLQARDSIRTQEESYAVITFVDGTTVELEPETGVAISSLLQGRANQPLATAIALRQRSGITWSKVPTLVSSSLFQIETDAAVVLVRGTTLKVTVEPDAGRTQVHVYTGVAQVRAQGEEVSLAPNTQSMVEAGKPPEDPQPLTRPSERLRFTLSEPIWARATDPLNRSVGFTTPGLEVNQAPGGTTSLPFAGPRFFEIPVTHPGDYPVLIEGEVSGSYQLIVQGYSQGSPIFVDGLQGSIQPGQQFLGYFTPTLQNERLVGGRFASFAAPTGGAVPGKVVKTRRALAGVAVTATAVALVGQPTPILTQAPTSTRTATVTPTPYPTDVPTLTPTATRPSGATATPLVLPSPTATRAAAPGAPP